MFGFVRTPINFTRVGSFVFNAVLGMWQLHVSCDFMNVRSLALHSNGSIHMIFTIDHETEPRRSETRRAEGNKTRWTNRKFYGGTLKQKC